VDVLLSEQLNEIHLTITDAGKGFDCCSQEPSTGTVPSLGSTRTDQSGIGSLEYKGEYKGSSPQTISIGFGGCAYTGGPEGALGQVAESEQIGFLD
jgi:hypothetical protein